MLFITGGLIALGALYVIVLVGFRKAFLNKKEELR